MEQFKIMGGSQQGEGKCLQMMCYNCSLRSRFDSSTPKLLFSGLFAAIVFVFFHVSLKQNVEMFAQNVCPRWGRQSPTVHHMQLITVYLPCILSEHPDESQITSIQPLSKKLTETT